MSSDRPRAVRGPDGVFLDPWFTPADRRGFSHFLRWRFSRLGAGVVPDPADHELPAARPEIVERTSDEIRLTWVGHSTYLIQLPGVNLLTDPVWSRRVSPVQWAGPSRIRPPGVAFDDLPTIDVVLLSHDHFDHLDRPTVRRLHSRFGDDLQWIAPLGHAEWLRRQGITNALDLDWWQDAHVRTREGESRAGELKVTALPARHWTRRGPAASPRLWASFALQTDTARVYYGGDSAMAPFYEHIAQAHAPFDAVLLPIGAYEPRWFMQPAHMSPEEAVQAYQQLGGRGVFAAMHWGTFRLSDEPPLEPPVLTRAAWLEAGLPEHDLWIPRHGETRVLALEGRAVNTNGDHR